MRPRHHFVALALCGCAGVAAAQSVTLEQAIQSLNANLASMPYLNESDLLSDERAQRYQTARNFVREKQCMSGTANPLLMVFAPMRVNLRGEANGGVSVSGTRPGATERGPRAGSGDRFDIPMRVAALADLPNEYLKDMAALMDSKGLPEGVAAKLKKEVSETYEKLAATVSNLLNSFDSRDCRRTPRQREFLEQEVRFIFLAPTY